jgi:hypothetical protein
LNFKIKIRQQRCQGEIKAAKNTSILKNNFILLYKKIIKPQKKYRWCTTKPHKKIIKAAQKPSLAKPPKPQKIGRVIAVDNRHDEANNYSPSELPFYGKFSNFLHTFSPSGPGPAGLLALSRPQKPDG